MRKLAVSGLAALLLIGVTTAWAPPKPLNFGRIRTRVDPSPCRTEQCQNNEVPQVFSLEKTMQKLVAPLICALVIGSSFPVFAASDPTVFPASKRYWSIVNEGTPQERLQANEALLDHAVGTINTMYYDNSGGFNFVPRDLYDKWRQLRTSSHTNNNKPLPESIPAVKLDTREGAVQGLKWLVSTLNDPFSKYLTRDELYQELRGEGGDGFLGSGAIVKPPQFWFPTTQRAARPEPLPPSIINSKVTLLTTTRVDNLPVVTAVAPNSPAERAGVTVGDRVVSVGLDTFLNLNRGEVSRKLGSRYSAENYAGQADVTVAKPVSYEKGDTGREVVLGYRLSRVKVPTKYSAPFQVQPGLSGDSIVQYKLLTSSDSILDQYSSKVGYIRLTRFSRTASTRLFHAVDELEACGAQSYIIDLRNNYGGVIQEAMLTASTLLRDPHAVLCYTMNSRGGFTPHDVEEYVVDTRYPGYKLSNELSTVTVNQVRRDNPEMFDGINVPPSSFRSMHEQSLTRSIHHARVWNAGWSSRDEQVRMQKKLVLLINEGTASSAEVFASALHDNGRTVALVGTKTYGKGLIQHTFPMPDGGGLRLTVAEYLTPSLHHVTKVGSAGYDRETGDFVGGGIKPDIVCESKGGIPSNAGADFCVATALDALDEAETQEAFFGGISGSQSPRRPIFASGWTDDF